MTTFVRKLNRLAFGDCVESSSLPEPVGNPGAALDTKFKVFDASSTE